MGGLGFRVVEYSQGVAAAYCGKLLRELGCEVVRGPAPLDDAHADLYLNAGKEIVDDAALAKLAALADLVITDRPGLFDRWPGLVVTITPFGVRGPYATFEATELVAQAVGGLVHLTGVPDREPLMAHGSQASYVAGTSAAAAALAAIYGGRSNGERIDVSAVETVASILEGATQLHQYQSGNVRRRMGNQWPGSGPCSDIYQTADGFISLAAETIPQWQGLCGLMGRSELADDPRFASFADQVAHADDLADIIREWFRVQRTEEVFHAAQEWRVPIGPIRSIAGVLDDPQLAAIGAWEEIEGLRVPARPFAREAGDR